MANHFKDWAHQALNMGKTAEEYLVEVIGYHQGPSLPLREATTQLAGAMDALRQQPDHQQMEESDTNLVVEGEIIALSKTTCEITTAA